jgi:CHAD domain-containing protein
MFLPRFLLAIGRFFRSLYRRESATPQQPILATGAGLRVIVQRMALQLKTVERPSRKFRKYLKRVRSTDTSAQPAPEDIHVLRTQTRHLEAAVRALALDAEPSAASLLKQLKPIRKQAGRVRDMDVMVGFAATLRQDRDDPAVVTLLEFLAAQRTRAAARLLRVIAVRERKTLKHLKDCVRLTRQQQQAQAGNGGPSFVKPAARALHLQAELAAPPTLNSANLHAFRLTVKELRFVLQMGTHPASEFNAALGEVKDQIGAWHDWSGLATATRKALGRKAAAKLLKAIRSRTKEELAKALEVSNALRARYFEGDTLAQARKAPVREIGSPAVRAAARLAG